MRASSQASRAAGAPCDVAADAPPVGRGSAERCGGGQGGVCRRRAAVGVGGERIWWSASSSHEVLCELYEVGRMSGVLLG